MPNAASDLASRRQKLTSELTRLAPRIEALASDLHRLPEPACREVGTVARVAGELEEEGFRVETGTGGLATAFRAERGEGPGAAVAFLAEYDAIPGMGHACGHNLLVAASCGAAVALARAAEGLPGRVLVIGAPAEETIGGKVVLAACGAYDGLDAALLAHPGAEDRTEVTSLASWSVEVVFEGRAAHAVAAPEEGINALDAMVQLLVARDALLKSLAPDVRMPGVVLEGGQRPNLVPERARARFSLRAADAGYLVDVVLARFRALVDGVALATGTTAHVTPIDNLYDSLAQNPVLAELYTRHARAAGLNPRPGAGRPVGSLDIGSISRRVPVLHPFFRISDEPIGTHTRAFTAAAASPRAFEATRRAALAIGLTGLDLLADPDALERVRNAHRDRPAAVAPRHATALITEQVES